MRNAVLVVIGLVFVVGMANATVPDATLCSVDPCDGFPIPGVITHPYDADPAGEFEFTVNVRNADDDPIPAAYVELTFVEEGNHCLCASVVLTGTTDASGDVTFNVAAGGCTAGMSAFIITANTVDIREYDYAKSPDWAGACDGGVTLADFTDFGAAYAGGGPGCHDYDNNGSTSLGDFSIFGTAWQSTCTL